MPIPYDKGKMKALSEGFGESGGEQDPLVQKIAGFFGGGETDKRDAMSEALKRRQERIKQTEEE